MARFKNPATSAWPISRPCRPLTVTVDYAEQGKSSWKGASLMAIIDKAATIQPEGHGAYLQHLILARGTDGYGVGIAIGEIEPKFEGKPVIIAYEKDASRWTVCASSFRATAMPGAGVRDLSEITVQLNGATTFADAARRPGAQGCTAPDPAADRDRQGHGGGPYPPTWSACCATGGAGHPAPKRWRTSPGSMTAPFRI